VNWPLEIWDLIGKSKNDDIGCLSTNGGKAGKPEPVLSMPSARIG
jgi:hypothetical protein